MLYWRRDHHKTGAGTAWASLSEIVPGKLRLVKNEWANSPPCRNLQIPSHRTVLIPTLIIAVFGLCARG